MKRLGFLVYLAVMAGSSAFGVEASMDSNGSKMHVEMTTEQRLKMADILDKMAICIRTQRSIPDCHQDMMTVCKSTMGKSGCHMMGEEMHHNGRRG